jgi:hypothetical protein
MNNFEHMKLFLITATAAIILYCEASAQGTFYNVGFGYGFPAGDWLGVTESGNVEKNVNGSFAKGLTAGANIGHMVNSTVGLDLGVWFVTGSTYEFILFSGNGNSVHLVSGHTIRIMPCIKVVGGNSNNLYAKFGLLLGIETVLNDEETFTPSTGSGTTIYPSHKFTGGFANGLTGALGIDVSENKNASVFIELNFCHQFFRPDLETVTTPGQPTQRYSLMDEPNPSAPNVKLKPSFSFSTIGLTAGIKFSSSVKKKSAAPVPTNK